MLSDDARFLAAYQPLTARGDPSVVAVIDVATARLRVDYRDSARTFLVDFVPATDTFFMAQEGAGLRWMSVDGTTKARISMANLEGAPRHLFSEPGGARVWLVGHSWFGLYSLAPP